MLDVVAVRFLMARLAHLNALLKQLRRDIDSGEQEADALRIAIRKLDPEQPTP